MKNNLTCILLTPLLMIMIGCSSQQSQSQTNKATSDEPLARNTLETYLNSLHNRRYTEAAQLYGGTYEVMMEHNPDVLPNEPAALFRNACTFNGMQCLQLRHITLAEKMSDSEFVFKVDFLKEDGTEFVLGPCCGSSEPNYPSQSAFYFTVKKIESGRFIVMDTPPYIP